MHPVADLADFGDYMVTFNSFSILRRTLNRSLVSQILPRLQSQYIQGETDHQLDSQMTLV